MKSGEMMYCDIKTLIDIIYRQLVTSSVSTYSGLINQLFKSYFEAPTSLEYDRSEPSKLHSGTRILSSKLTDFYIRKDKSVLLGDIKDMLKYILDKSQLHVSLFDLVMNDTLISKPFKKQFGNNNSRNYSDDEHLAEVFYTALFIAAYRPYYKDNGTFHADYYFEDNNNTDGLFSNAKPKAPAKYFSGRKKELKELHAMVQNESKVFVTGVAGIGKSELVRAYIQEYGSEYVHIGMYSYKCRKNLQEIIETIIPSVTFTRNETDNIYNENLELLSSLGRKTLLVIDDYNIPAYDDENLPDLLETDCDIIFISFSHYDEDFNVFEVKEFRTNRECYELIQKFYPFDMDDNFTWNQMLRLLSITGKYPYSLELCARSLKHGSETPNSIADALCKGMKNMKARIPSNKDGKPKKDTYYNHIKNLFEHTELEEADKYALSYMRFMPGSGVPKLLFIELTGLIDMTSVDRMIDLGFIHENSDGTIYLPSVIKELVESDDENFAIDPDDFRYFTEMLFLRTTKDTPKEILSDIANNISPLKYFQIIEPDIFIAKHILFKYLVQIEDSFGMQMAIINLAAMYNKNLFKHRILYLEDKAQYLEIIKYDEDYDETKKSIEIIENDPMKYNQDEEREPIEKSITLTEEEARMLGLIDDDE